MARRRKSTARTKPDRQLTLTLAASVLAAAALGGCDSRASSARAPSCPPVTTQPGSAGWDDRDGCWERQPDGHAVYRTSSGGHYFYYSSPPSYSRYSDTGGRWFSSSKFSGGYHGAPGAGA